MFNVYVLVCAHAVQLCMARKLFRKDSYYMYIIITVTTLSRYIPNKCKHMSTHTCIDCIDYYRKY